MYKIILASGSPRRKQILADAGFEFEVLHTDTDESFPADMPVKDIPLMLAKRKMEKAVKKQSGANNIIITADTVVILENEIINKPASHAEAVLMLKKLSGKMHTVISGVCIYSGEHKNAFSSKTDVYFEELSNEEIEFYLGKYQPFDKAGAYAIQEWIGLNKIAGIKGDYYNVVGFPMSRIYKILLEVIPMDEMLLK